MDREVELLGGPLDGCRYTLPAGQTEYRIDKIQTAPLVTIAGEKRGDVPVSRWIGKYRLMAGGAKMRWEGWDRG